MSEEYNNAPSVDSALRGGGGAPAFKLENRSKVTGTLVDARMTPVLYPKDHPKSGQHKHYEKTGKPAYQIVLTLTDTDAPRADDDDNGTRRVFVKEFGRQRDALTEALDAHKGKESKIADAYGSRLTVSHEGETAPPFRGASGEKILGFSFHSDADRALGRGQHDPHKVEHRAEPKAEPAGKDVRALLRENGLPEELASVVGEDPTPELIEALKANHRKG